MEPNGVQVVGGSNPPCPTKTPPCPLPAAGMEPRFRVTPIDVRHIAVAVIVAVMVSGCRRNPADELNAAARTLEYRPVEGRLSGWPYAMPPSARRANEVYAKVRYAQGAGAQCRAAIRWTACPRAASDGSARRSKESFAENHLASRRTRHNVERLRGRASRHGCAGRRAAVVDGACRRESRARFTTHIAGGAVQSGDHSGCAGSPR